MHRQLGLTIEYIDRHSTRTQDKKSSTNFFSTQRLTTDIPSTALACYTDRHSSIIRLLEKSLFSPARPEAAKTASLPRVAPFPCGVFETLEAYLVKRRSFADSDVSRFTFHV
jgi:hypothetical protein